MGLDIVELVMEVEDAFGIQIPDKDYEQIRTVGDLHDYIVRHRQPPDVEDSNKARVCLTSATFLRLRRAFIQLFGISRRSVRTSSQLDELVPRVNRREKWNQLQEMVQLKLPALERPFWLFFLLAVCVISLASCFLWLIAPLGLAGILVTLFLMIATSMGLAALTRPFA
ncbi:MAG TPA: acyl carrier protein, partial [Planctomycetaceae bacterium]|nr:acyl carrier protein [Planctomycetaceae bacterium]